MACRQVTSGRVLGRTLLTLALTIGLLRSARAQQPDVKVLQIGSSESLTGAVNKEKEKGAMDSLKAFIKDETGLENVIERQKDWRAVTNKLAKRELHLGVYQGYEFAWAQGDQPGLKPLAIAVNVYRYPVVYVIVNKSDPAKNFAGLQGKSISIPANGQGILRLFVDRQAQALGKTVDTFASKITTPEDVESALDDVVDNMTQATVVDRAALEAFKRRKPARFAKLRPVAQSQPLPPPVIAYFEKHLDDATLERLQKGLLGASQKERGQTLLTLFHLTNFELSPPDFGQVLEATRKAYPPSPASK
jgi:ABC-type phosphate/phosphonate transport system substrate-binding protein